MTVEELQVVITAKTAGLQSQLNDVSNKLNGLQSTTQKSVSGITRSFNKLIPVIAGVFAVKKIIDFGKASTKAFNDTAVASAKLERVMKNTMGATSDHIEDVKKLMSFQELGGVVGVDVQLAGAQELGTYLTEAESLKKIIPIMNDMAAQQFGLDASAESVTNIATMLGKVMNGQVGALSRYGYSFTKAQEKILKFGTEAERAAVLADVVGESVGGMNAALAKTPAGQMKQLQFALDGVKSAIGEGIMSAVQAALPALNAMANMLLKVAQAFSAFMQSIFGKTIKMQDVQINGTQDQVSAVESLGDAADDAGESAKKAGKKAKNAVAGFDEINSLTKDSGSGDSSDGGGLGGMETSSVMTDAVESFSEKMEGVIARLKELFKEGFDIGLGDGWRAQVDDIKKSIQGIKDSLKDIFTDGEVKDAFSKWVDAWAITSGKITGSAVSIGTTIAQNLTGGIDKYLAQNAQFIKDRIVGILNASAEISNLAGDFAVAFADIFSVFGGETGQQITANIIAMFSNAFLTSLELGLKFGSDIIKAITLPIIKNKDAIKDALEGTLSALSKLTGTVAKLVTDLCKTAISVYDKYISPAYGRMADAFTKILGKLVDAYNTYILPMLDNWADEFQKLYDDYIGPIMTKFLTVVGQLAELCGYLWQNVLAPFVSWLIDIAAPLLAGSLDNIKRGFDVVIKFILKALDGLLTVLQGVITFLTGVFTLDWNKTWEGIKLLVDGAGKFIYAVTVQPLIDIGKYLVGAFVTAWKSSLTAIQNTFKPLSNWFSNSVVTPITTAFSKLWNGIKTGSSAAFNAVGNSAKSGMNWIITHINNMINKINSKLRFTLPDIMGGGTVGFSIPNVPKLARGGIVDGATFMGGYVAGEAGKEMVVPLENTSFTDKIASAMGQAVMNAMSVMLNGNSNVAGNEQSVSLEMDGTVFARSVTPYVIKEIKRLGFDI